MFGNAGEHARADFFSLVEGKCVVGPSGLAEYPMGAVLSFNAPTEMLECF